MNAPSTLTASSAPAPAAATQLASSPQGPQAELTEAEAAKMSDWVKQDLALGRITPEQATKMFNELGRTMEQRLPDQLSDEQKELDAAFPPALASDYTIRYGLPGQDVVMTQEMQHFDATARTWLSVAQFPRELGNRLINAIAKTVEHTRSMTPDQLEHYGYAVFAKLEQVFGEKLDDKLRSAGRMVEALDANPLGLKDLLKSKGIGDCALIASLLVQQSERYWARCDRFAPRV